MNPDPSVAVIVVPTYNSQRKRGNSSGVVGGGGCDCGGPR